MAGYWKCETCNTAKPEGRFPTRGEFMKAYGSTFVNKCRSCLWAERWGARKPTPAAEITGVPAPSMGLTQALALVQRLQAENAALTADNDELLTMLLEITDAPQAVLKPVTAEEHINQYADRYSTPGDMVKVYKVFAGHGWNWFFLSNDNLCREAKIPIRGRGGRKGTELTSAAKNALVKMGLLDKRNYGAYKNKWEYRAAAKWQKTPNPDKAHAH